MDTKKCSKCDEIKEITNFYKRSPNKPLSECKSCIAVRTAEYYKNNREKRLKYHRGYAKSPNGKEKVKKGIRKYSKTSKGKVAQQKWTKSEAGKKCAAKRTQKYRQTLQGKANHSEIQAKRRALKLQATPKWLTKEQRQEMKNLYIKRTLLTIETGTPYHVDHIVPLQGENVCGLHVPWNLQILSEYENCFKNNRLD
jgi:hypothetical protein